MIGLWLTLMTALADDECTPLSLERLRGELSLLARAFADRRGDVAHAVAAQMRAGLPCLSGPLEPVEVGQVASVLAWLSLDGSVEVSAKGAAWARLGRTLGADLPTVFADLPPNLPDAPSRSLPEGSIVDGIAARSFRPCPDCAHIIQRQDDDTWHTWLVVGEDPPQGALRPPPVRRTTVDVIVHDDGVDVDRRVPPQKHPAMAAGGVLLGVAGGLLVGHVVMSGRFDDKAPLSEHQIRRDAAVTNGLLLGAGALGFAGAGALGWGLWVADGPGHGGAAGLWIRW